MPHTLPRILIIDDLFGRTHPDRRNEERAQFCANYLLADVTGDEADKPGQTIKTPIAEAVFQRGQTPRRAVLGDTVENDLPGVLATVRAGWEKSGQTNWALVLLDLSFQTGQVMEESYQRPSGIPTLRPDEANPQHYFGLEILDALHNEFPDLPVAILSGMARNEVSREFSSKGAVGFLSRDEAGYEGLWEFICRHGLLPDETGQIAGDSKPLLLMLRMARRVALTQQNVILRGERGTGKELLAHYIHMRRAKLQKDRPLVTVNSALFTPEMFASELFGIGSKVATGVDAHPGLIEQAEGGDLFFDEIKDMPPQVQAGILRVIDQGEVQRLGGLKPKRLKVRFLAATNADINALAAAGTFRADLLDRLSNGGIINLPPLRERPEDIPLLAERFIRQAEQETPQARPRELDPAALDKLCSYAWPENVRGLRSCLFAAVSNYPDVEYLMPMHVQLPGTVSPAEIRKPLAIPPAPAFETEAAGRSEIDVTDLDGLMRIMEGLRFDPAKPVTLAGKLERLKEAYSQLLARYLAAALQATSRPTPACPEGEVFISPAIKLMTGNRQLSTGEAADEVKRILRDSPETVDRVLREAHAEALKLRPRQPRSK